MRPIFLAPAVFSLAFMGTEVLPARASTVDVVDPVSMTLNAYAFAFPGPPPGGTTGCGGSLPACPRSRRPPTHCRSEMGPAQTPA
jgi:hypothetical protein